MRSRKESPGAAVMRTLIQSESTTVPPVTAERSPPDSRITGADSPVMALSLTEAMPSIDVAVGGDDVAGLDQHDIADPRGRPPARCSQVVRGVVGIEALGRECRLARAPQAVGLRLAAPFGDGLGEVGKQHREPEPGGDLAGRTPTAGDRRHRSRTKISVTTSATTSVTKITGLRTSLRGSSLANGLAMAARRRIAGSSRARALCVCCHWWSPLEGLAGEHQEVLDDGAEREGREDTAGRRGSG